jgi:hypothetical protein
MSSFILLTRMKALAGIPVPIGWTFGIETLRRGCEQHDKPFSKDRMTPKAATSIDKIFWARGLLLKVTIAVAIPMNAVPTVQMKESFHTNKWYNQQPLLRRRIATSKVEYLLRLSSNQCATAGCEDLERQ